MIIYPNNASDKIGFSAIRQAALRKAFTPYGKEFLQRHLPSSYRAEVELQLKQASEWMKLLQQDSPPPLANLNDIRDMVSESLIKGNLLPLNDFADIFQNARLARVLKSYFDRLQEDCPALLQIVKRLVNLKPLEEAIQKVITERGELRDDASPQLKQIRNRKNREQGKLRSTIQRVMQRATKQGMTSDEGPTIRSGRMVIPIQAEFKRKVDGFIHDVSSTGQTVYLEPVEALQINNEIRQLESEENREIERIIRQLTTEVRKYADNLLSNTTHFGLLDAIHCRVSLGLDLNGVIPVISDNQNLHLIRALNPNLLLKNLSAKEPEAVVPLDMHLFPEQLGLVITGPNAGGKSVAMKTVGLLSLMMQSGYPVPVQPDTQIPIISGLFVDLGDEQSIESDLSTFSSRLEWIRTTLQQLRPGALVLIDEAGSGTDPDEGGALFQAFIEEVIKKISRTIVTTHHGSLKVFAHEHPHVVNGAMEFNQENLSPTYRFKKGIPGSSYAFEIAERMNIPENVMANARGLLGEKRDRMGELLINLEKKMQESEDLSGKFRSKLRDAEKREKNYRELTEQFEKKKKKILERAYKDAEEIMSGANRRIEEAVEKVVSEGREDKEKIREARREIEESKKEIRSSKNELAETAGETVFRSDEKPEKGDYVLIGDSDTSGELVELSGNNATVLVNGMKIKAKLNKLVKTNAPSKKQKSSFARSYQTSQPISLDVKPSLDLRGKRGDEAIKELTLYLDKAITRGLKQVEIIHGKGEGILHKLVHEYLENRKEVKSFDIAPWESGGTGCTVVEL